MNLKFKCETKRWKLVFNFHGVNNYWDSRNISFSHIYKIHLVFSSEKSWPLLDIFLMNCLGDSFLFVNTLDEFPNYHNVQLFVCASKLNIWIKGTYFIRPDQFKFAFQLNSWVVKSSQEFKSTVLALFLATSIKLLILYHIIPNRNCSKT